MNLPDAMGNAPQAVRITHQCWCVQHTNVGVPNAPTLVCLTHQCWCAQRTNVGVCNAPMLVCSIHQCWCVQRTNIGVSVHQWRVKNREWRVENGWRASELSIIHYPLSILHSPVIPTGAARHEPRSGGNCSKTQGGAKQQTYLSREAHTAADASTPLRSARNDATRRANQLEIRNQK
jgi:hypothetical protein